MKTTVGEYNIAHQSTYALRIGIHSGPVLAMKGETEQFNFNLWGETVSLAKHLESLAANDHLRVTEDAYKLLHDKFDLREDDGVDLGGKRVLSTYLLIGRK